jgi:hypothetical protein
LTDNKRGEQWAISHSTTNANKNPFIGDLPKSGMSVDKSIEVYDKYRTLNDSDGLKPKEKAEAFKAYIDSLLLPKQQMDAVKEVYTFWGNYPIKW